MRPPASISGTLNRLLEALRRRPIAHRIARGVFWSSAGWAVSRLATLGSTVFMARLIGREGYGEVGMVQSTLGLFGVLAGFGLGATATKHIAEFRTADPTRAGRVADLTLVVSTVSGGVLAVACAVASPWLSGPLLGREGLAPLLAGGSLLLLLSTLGGVCSAVLAGFEDFRSVARIGFLQGLATPFVAVPCVFLWGVGGAVVSMTIVAGIGLAFAVPAMRAAALVAGVPLGAWSGIFREIPLLWRFSAPSFLSGLLVVPVTWVTNLILVRQPAGYGEMGLFSVANQWRVLVMVLPGFLTASLLPVFAQQRGLADREEFEETFDVCFRLTAAVALPLAVGVILFSEALTALFGRQFDGSGPVTAVLMVAVFFNTVNSVAGTALTGAGRMWTGFAMNLGWAVALLASAAVFVPLRGALGLASAYAVAYLLHTLWVLAYTDCRIVPGIIRRSWPMAMLVTVVLSASLAAVLLGGYPPWVRLALMLVATSPLVGFSVKSGRALWGSRS